MPRTVEAKKEWYWIDCSDPQSVVGPLTQKELDDELVEYLDDAKDSNTWGGFDADDHIAENVLVFKGEQMAVDVTTPDPSYKFTYS